MKREPGKFGKVAVLMGGTSAEREISLQTGQAVFEALRRRHIDAHEVDARDDFLFRLVDEGFDRVFIALHGRRGEDGVIQGALETLHIPYTGSGVLGSALAMDKVRSKLIWQSLGLPTPPFVEVTTEKDLERADAEVEYPMIVKPVHEGSSCGASKVRCRDDLEQAWRLAQSLDDRVLAEHWVTGPEYTAGILGDRVLPLIRIETPREFYDFEAKYSADTTRKICPCGLPGDEEKLLGDMVMRAFRALGAGGWGRVDFLMDAGGAPWLIEVNTIPGMTSHSLVPIAAAQVGMGFDDLVVHILESSVVDAFATTEGAAA